MNESGGNHTPNNMPHEAGPKAETNARSLALSEKVRSLRLSDRLNKSSGGAGPSGGIVWVLFALILLLAGAVGYSVYSTQTTLKKLDELDKKAASAAKKIEEDKLE